MKISLSQSRNIIILAVLGLMLVVGVGSSLWLHASQFMDINAGPIQFRVNKLYVAEEVENKKDSHTQHLIFLKREHPTTTLAVDKETGAIVSANVVHANFLDTLEKNAKRLFPLSYPDYQEESIQRIQLNNRDAVDFLFSYSGGKNRIYAHYIIMPVDNDAYYVVVQSESMAELNAVQKQLQSTLKLAL